MPTFSFATARDNVLRANAIEFLQPVVKHGQVLTPRKPVSKRCQVLQWGSWNIRTVHSQFSVAETGELRLEGAEPQKTNDLCFELHSHGISFCAIPEHRWQGSGIFVLMKTGHLCVQAHRRMRTKDETALDFF